MNNFFLDADIVIDVLMARKPFVEISSEIFRLAENNKVNLFISALSYWNIYYIIKKSNSHENAIEILKELNNYITAINVGQEIITLSINSSFNDFEDSIQYHSAIAHGKITAVVTRNSKDFKLSELPVLNPEQALALIS